MIDITRKEIEESNAIEICGIEFVRVVRCKDCESVVSYTCGGANCLYCGEFNCLYCVVNDRDVDENDFCSYGKKRDECN